MPLSGMATAGLCRVGQPLRMSSSSFSLNFFMAVRSPCTKMMLSGKTVRMKALFCGWGDKKGGVGWGARERRK